MERPDRRPANVAGAVYGLILAEAVIAAADTGTDSAAVVAGTVAVTLLVFFLAHVYAVLMGRWSEQGIFPGWGEWKLEMVRQWPMLSVAILPVAVLLLGVLGIFSDTTAVNVAFFLCVGALSATAWYAAREAGATRVQSVMAVAVAVFIGLVIVALKVLLLH